MQETQGTGIRFLGGEDPLEGKMTTHSSILDEIIPWTEEPGRLQSMRLQRARHNSGLGQALLPKGDGENQTKPKKTKKKKTQSYYCLMLEGKDFHPNLFKICK